MIAILGQRHATGEVGEFLNASVDHPIVKDRSEKADNAIVMLEDKAAHVFLARPGVVKQAAPLLRRNRRGAKNVEQWQHGFEALRRRDFHLDHDAPCAARAGRIVETLCICMNLSAAKRLARTCSTARTT